MEILLVCAGDEIITAGGPISPLLQSDQYAGPLPTGLIERADERTTLTYKQQPFSVATRIDDTFGVLRSVYVVHGSEGLERFFRENSFVPRRFGSGKEVTYIDPEEFLGQRVHLYRLFREANIQIRARARELREQVQPLAQQGGLQQLDGARGEIESEAARYFRSIDSSRAAARLLGSGNTLYGQLLDINSRDVIALRAELKAIRPFITAAEQAQADWLSERSRRYQELREVTFDACMALDRPAAEAVSPQIFENIMREIEQRFPRVAQLEAQARAQRELLLQEIQSAAFEFPILWRIYATPHLNDPTALGRQMFEQLQSAWTGNRDLQARLAGDAELVWQLPALVRAQLTQAGVNLYSIAWSACEEQIQAEIGTRVAASVSMVSGLAQLGVVGVAALAGASVIAQPLVIALFAIEAISSIVDAVQEYQQYRLQSAAFRAALDPNKALAAEPSLLSAIFTIGFDLLALLPPARAVR
jgi:hypothetical protein